MKLRQLLPLALALVATSTFAANKMTNGTHHLNRDCGKVVNSFKHSLVKSDKKHLIFEARRLCRSIAHFQRRLHKKFIGITVGHKHNKHKHLIKDFRNVKINMRHLNKSFHSKSRPHHVKGRMSHLNRWYRYVHKLLHQHTA